MGDLGRNCLWQMISVSIFLQHNSSLWFLNPFPFPVYWPHWIIYSWFSLTVLPSPDNISSMKSNWSNQSFFLVCSFISHMLLKYIWLFLLIKLWDILCQGDLACDSELWIPWVWWAYYRIVVCIWIANFFSPNCIFSGNPIFGIDKWNSSQVELKMDSPQSQGMISWELWLIWFLSHSLTQDWETQVVGHIFLILLAE